jgi:protein-disulfide isomerase
MNRFTVLMIVLAIGFIGFLAVNRQDPVASGEPSNHTVGAGTSGVTFVEFSDFQCPACELYYPVVNAVKEAYGDEVTFQFRHFPIISIHPNAMAAHRAAEAAGKQDAFFAMHSLLFERYDSWNQSNNVRAIFDGYASELGLDMEQFTADVESSEVLATINADRALGTEEGVTGTPSFFVDGKQLDTPQGIEDFFSAIDAAIEEKTGEPSQRSLQNNDVNENRPEEDSAETEAPGNGEASE